MPRFNLTQLFAAIAILSLVLALTQAEGCGSAYSTIHSLAFSPDGQQLAVAKLNYRDARVSLKAYAADLARTISLIDVETMTPTRVIVRDFRAGNHGSASQFRRRGRESLAFAADGDSLLFVEFGGGTIQRFDLNSNRLTKFFDPRPPGKVDDFALSRDRTVLGASIWNGGVSLLAANDGQTLNKLAAFVIAFNGPGIGISADNCWIAIPQGEDLQVYDANSKLRAAQSFPCSGAFEFGPRAGQLVIANENSVMLCDLSLGESRTVSNDRDVNYVRFLDDVTLVIATRTIVRLVNFDTGHETTRFTRANWISALACSPDGHTIAFGDREGVVVWDVTSGRASTIQVPGKSGYPWTIPVGALALLAMIYVRIAQKRIANAANVTC